MRAVVAFVLVLALALAALVAGCHHKDGAGSAGGDASAEGAPFAVSDASQGLLFTWIDEKGDFHVEEKAASVPIAGRDAVRVVDPNRDEGTHADRIFVADLRTARPDGSYAVHATTKAEFDRIAVDRRKAHASAILVETDGAAPPPGAGGAFAQGPGADNPGGGGTNRPAVIIYGAEWCGACHQAAAYCRTKGIPFVEKDIESDPAAAKEMSEKLAKNGLPRGSIPVIDVRGKVIVGFSPQSLESALGNAL